MSERAVRAGLAADARAGFPGRRGGARRIAARAAFARAIWTRTGERKVPTEVELDRALSALTAEDLEFVCELAPLGPLYFLPTRRFVRALVTTLRTLGARRVLEIGAGDGLLSRALRKAAPELTVIASDSGAWERPEARMNAADKREHRGRDVPGLRLEADVQRLDALPAIARHRPDVVLAAWLPPGDLLDALIRTKVRYVLELGAPGGATPSAYSWRFAHDFLDGPIETSARCRLDLRPQQTLHSRVTAYFGARHPEHAEEPVSKGDWLYQFRPRSGRAAQQQQTEPAQRKTRSSGRHGA